MNKALQFVLVALIIGGISFWYSRREQRCMQIDSATLIVGTNAEYPPFSFKDNGEIVGFDIDIVKAVAERLHKKIEFIDMAFSMLIPRLQLGNLQIVAAGASPSPEREKQVFFTKPYLMDDPLVIITRADHAPLTSVAALTGQKVIVNDGFTADFYLSGLTGFHITRLPTVADAFLALISKRADAFVSARAAVEPFFQQADRSKFIITPLPDKSDSYVLIISRHYPELLEQVQQALDMMKQDGTINTIKQKWNLS